MMLGVIGTPPAVSVFACQRQLEGLFF